MFLINTTIALTLVLNKISDKQFLLIRTKNLSLILFNGTKSWGKKILVTDYLTINMQKQEIITLDSPGKL